METPSNKEGGWTEVKRKFVGTSPGEASPSPPITFRNLKVVDEIDAKLSSKITVASSARGNSGSGSTKRLTKSQKKRLKASRGGESPPLS